MHEIKVDFRIVDFDCSVEEITSTVGINPTKVYVKGEYVTVGKSRRLRKENMWILESQSNDTLSLETHLEELAEKIKPHFDMFKLVCNKYYSEFACRIYLKKVSEESIPSVHLSADFTKLLSQLSSELDIDIYML
ncbi:DUF4279 domain-containing protein [Niabella sp. 22666]|uniref:DUF4279 domain-containing protein n=1 Tax=Niabella sp. 22666 TaxID=3453954 RepID=UPI003F83BB7E